MSVYCACARCCNFSRWLKMFLNQSLTNNLLQRFQDREFCTNSHASSLRPFARILLILIHTRVFSRRSQAEIDCIFPSKFHFCINRYTTSSGTWTVIRNAAVMKIARTMSTFRGCVFVQIHHVANTHLKERKFQLLVLERVTS